MIRWFLFLVIACTLTSCFRHLTSPAAIAGQHHGTSFRIHKDSVPVVWARLQEFFSKPANSRNPIMIVTDVLIQTAPAITPGSTQYAATKMPIGQDSFEVTVSDTYLSSGTYDIYGPSFARATTHEAALYAHLGSRQQRYIDSIAALGVNPLEMTEKSAPKGGLWLGPSYGKHKWGFDMGGRYSFIGLGLHYLDLGSGDAMPDFVDTYIPHSNYKTHRYAGSLYGVSVFLFWDITDDLQINGNVGYFERSYTYLDRSNVTGDYWLSHRQSDSYDKQWGGGLGLTYFIADWFGLGVGYRSIDGADFDFAFRF